jgi:predicted nucleic acid-binding protein
VNDRVLLDTSALFAVVAPSDKSHSQAKPLYDALIDRKAELYITSYTLLESISIVHRRLGFAVLKKLMDALDPVITIYWVEQEIHNAAWTNLSLRDGVGPSLVDWTTIIVARRLNIPVFAFDKHLEAEGLSVIPRKV